MKPIVCAEGRECVNCGVKQVRIDMLCPLKRADPQLYICKVKAPRFHSIPIRSEWMLSTVFCADAVVATRWSRPLPVQRVRPLPEDERVPASAHQTEAPHGVPPSELFYSLQYSNIRVLHMTTILPLIFTVPTPFATWPFLFASEWRLRRTQYGKREGSESLERLSSGIWP